MRYWIFVVTLVSAAAQAFAQAPPPGSALADPRKDPGGWPKAAPGSGQPDVRGGSGNWWWGDLEHGRTYTTSLTVTNDCETTETASIFVNGLPLQAPASVIVPGKSSQDVVMTITLDAIPESSLPRPRGDAYVAGNIDGSVVIWHPWTSKCLPRRDEYVTGGYIIAPGPPDAQKVGGDPCRVLATLGMLPSTFEEKLRAARGERLAPEDEQTCEKDTKEIDERLKKEIAQMAQEDPTLMPPAPFELRRALDALSTRQLVGVRDELLTRARVPGGGR